jgi:uncharacterized protein (TIGR00251 family)
MKISVVVHPNSRNPRVREGLAKILHVYVNAPPLDGRANKAVIEALSKFFGTKKSKIVLLRGSKSKVKIFEIYTIKSLSKEVLQKL